MRLSNAAERSLRKLFYARFDIKTRYSVRKANISVDFCHKMGDIIESCQGVLVFSG